jgi:hypothetical protein
MLVAQLALKIMLISITCLRNAAVTFKSSSEKTVSRCVYLNGKWSYATVHNLVVAVSQLNAKVCFL